MAKYLLSYDEQDVKNGNLDVSPDGVLKSAGKSGSDEPVLPQKVLFRSTDSEGNILCCGQKASEMTIEEGLALCLSKMPYVMGGEDWFGTAVRIVDAGSTTDKALAVAGVHLVAGSCAGSTTQEPVGIIIMKTSFKQS
jgi:hypothetical protein